MFPWTRTKARPAPLGREASLSMIPVRLVEVVEEPLDDERIRLCWQVRYRPGFSSFLGRLGLWSDEPLKKRLELDILGTASWRLFDGRTSVAAAAAELAHRFGMTRHETEAAMAAFVRALGKRGLVGLAAATDAPERTS